MKITRDLRKAAQTLAGMAEKSRASLARGGALSLEAAQ